jgi:hypothetical protein
MQDLRSDRLLAANIYLNDVDWAFEAIRSKTAEGPFEAVNYHRFADDIVITVSGQSSKRGWSERALQRLQEQLAPLGVELNGEKGYVCVRCWPPVMARSSTNGGASDEAKCSRKRRQPR